MPHFLDRLYNLHWVTPDVARSAQPWLGFYGSYLRANAIRSIVNLRGENPGHAWWRRETRIAQRLGVAHFDIRMSSRLLPAHRTLTGLLDAFDRAPRPLLLKCSGGQDRAAVASALYLLAAGGAGALASAQMQFARWPYLHMPKARQLWLREFPAFAVEQAKGQRIGEWVRQSYDPGGFAAWLEAHGRGRTYLAIQTLPDERP
jgi:protein tyrosine/serine phosphatase